MDDWLARLRHDLVKRAVWRARDLHELSRPPRADDLWALRRGLLELRDGDGRPVTATQLWRAFRNEVEGAAPAAALDAFGRAIARAQAASERLDEVAAADGAILAILAIEPAFDELARALGGAGPRREKR